MGGSGSGRGGLSPNTVTAAERLLNLGWSSYRIGAALGIDPTTVQRIARGEHFSQMDPDKVRWVRCSSCGATADQSPCRLCVLRQQGL